MKNIELNAEMEYTLVPETESDVMQNKISVSSPIGKGILGKKVGEIAEVQTPGGLIKLEILEIKR
jgi:transcription elongation factor GreA